MVDNIFWIPRRYRYLFIVFSPLCMNTAAQRHLERVFQCLETAPGAHAGNSGGYYPRTDRAGLFVPGLSQSSSFTDLRP